MSTPRIGPPGSPGIPAETPDHAPATAPGRPAAQADQLVHQSAPKVTEARPQQATTLAFDLPHQPERRAFFGGDRGAWPADVRQGILAAADNPVIGRLLLDAFARGLA